MNNFLGFTTKINQFGTFLSPILSGLERINDKPGATTATATTTTTIKMSETGKQRRLQKDDLVLVTGANGYIGSHVVDSLLEQGHRVRGTVRSPKPWLAELFDERHGVGRFEPFILPSFDDEAVLADALSGVKGVVHVVSFI